MTNPNDICTNPAGPELSPASYGLTKREYFAAMAMQGVIQMTGGPTGWDTPEIAAKFILEWTDALIAELNKGEPK
jgi:hypothetical protein